MLQNLKWIYFYFFRHPRNPREHINSEDNKVFTFFINNLFLAPSSNLFLFHYIQKFTFIGLRLKKEVYVHIFLISRRTFCDTSLRIQLAMWIFHNLRLNCTYFQLLVQTWRNFGQNSQCIFYRTTALATCLLVAKMIYGGKRRAQVGGGDGGFLTHSI